MFEHNPDYFKEIAGIKQITFLILMLSIIGFLLYPFCFLIIAFLKNKWFNKKVKKLIKKQINNSLNNWELVICYDNVFKDNISNRLLEFQIVTNKTLWEINQVVFIFKLNKKFFYFNCFLNRTSVKNVWIKIKNIKFEELWSKNTEEDFLILKNWIELNKNPKSESVNFLKEINLTKKMKKIEIKTKSSDEKLDLERDDIEFRNIFVKNIIKKNEVNESEFYVVPDKDNFALSSFSQKKLRILEESNYLIELTSRTNEINVKLHKNLLPGDMEWIKEIVWKDTP